jgi:hypothetical protein
MCLTEAAAYQTGCQFRALFTMILSNHDAVSAINLIKRHYEAL